MIRSVLGSKSPAVGKQKRQRGSRLRARRYAFIMSGLASMLCCPHFDITWASPTRWVSGGAFRVENAKAVITPVGDVDVAVGIDRHVGGVIKNPRLGCPRRGRGRKERTQIGPGEGILRYGKRPVFADRHDDLAARGELLHAVVLPVRDVDVPLVVEGDAPRLVEPLLATAAPAALGQGLAVGGEDLQAVVAAVDDNHVAAGVA